MIRTATVSVEELLEHSAWARALARQLVADAATADDLVQDTWLAAMLRPPLRGVPVRPWLASALRNAARMSTRTDARRSARERVAARDEALASTHELVELAARQRELVDALLKLDEPYRTTLLLRFFEALPPRRIAARLGVSVETVHTRQQRGLRRLRETLEQTHGGDRSAWLVALLPLARAPQA
jgi:RNA polymerase sigma-70 factor (ECF subfamily)